MTTNVESIITKWDNYLDDYYPDREPRERKRPRYGRYGVEDMLEIIQANNERRRAVENNLRAWQTVCVADAPKTKKTPDAKIKKTPKANRIRKYVRTGHNGQRKQNYYGTVVLRHPDGRETEHNGPQEAAAALGCKLATIYRCIYGTMRSVMGVRVRATTTKFRHNCIATVVRYPDGRVDRYESLQAAADATGKYIADVSRIIHGRRKPICGIRFERAK